jgi:hypothetical protein
MVRRTMRRTGARSKRRIRGGNRFMSFLKRANKFLRKTGAVSAISGALGKAGLPYASNISKYSKMAGYGYGRRGMGLRLAGRGLSTSGGMCGHRRIRRRRR